MNDRLNGSEDGVSPAARLIAATAGRTGEEVGDALSAALHTDRAALLATITEATAAQRTALLGGLEALATELRLAGERQAAGTSAGVAGLAAGITAAVTETVRAAFERQGEVFREQDRRLAVDVVAAAVERGLGEVTITQAAQAPPTVNNHVDVHSADLAAAVERLAELDLAPRVTTQPGELSVSVEALLRADDVGAALERLARATEQNGALLARLVSAVETQAGPRRRTVTHRYDADGRLAVSTATDAPAEA